MSRLRELKERVRQAAIRPLDPALERRRTHPAYLLRLALHIGRKWADDHSPQQAGLLAFQTSLSLVPLIAVGFALLRAIRMLEAQSALVDFIGKHVLPVSGEELTQRLMRFADNISSGALGPLGLTSALVLSYMLFHSVEAVFNDIWKVRERRSLVGKLTVFYPLATLSPLLMGVTLYYTTRFWRAAGLMGFIAPMLSTFLAFALANKLLPKTRVSWRAAMAGAVVSMVFFELAKHGFQSYVDKLAFSSFRGIYGALGLVPILLIWIYYSWLVVLFGAEVAYTTQNLPAIERQQRLQLRAASVAEETQQRVNGRVAARLLLAVADNFAAGNKALPQERLVERFGLQADVIDRVFSRLKQRDLAVEVFGEVAGYMPARPLDEITLRQVLEAFDGRDVEGEAADTLAEIQHELLRAREEVLAEVTYARLVQPAQRDRLAGRIDGAATRQLEPTAEPDDLVGATATAAAAAASREREDDQ